MTKKQKVIIYYIERKGIKMKLNNNGWGYRIFIICMCMIFTFVIDSLCFLVYSKRCIQCVIVEKSTELMAYVLYEGKYPTTLVLVAALTLGVLAMLNGIFEFSHH